MRLVRFEDGAGDVALEFHPHITVVGGLEPHARERLIQTVRALPHGGDVGGQGSIEVHGVLMDLTPETLELLELDADIDSIVAARDLRESQEEPEPEPEEAPVEQSSEVARLAQQVDHARLATAEAKDGLAEARRRLEHTVEGRQRLATRRAAFEAQIEAARPGLDPDSADALDEARRLLATAEQGVAQAPTDHQLRRRELETRIDAMRGQAEVLSRDFVPLADLDPGPVRNALHMLETAEPAALVPSPEAQQLAEQIETVRARQADEPPPPPGDRNLLKDLSARRDEAYDAFVDAERRLRSPELDPGLIKRLEEVHDEIFELDGKASRFNLARIRRRIGELRPRRIRSSISSGSTPGRPTSWACRPPRWKPIGFGATRWPRPPGSSPKTSSLGPWQLPTDPDPAAGSRS